MRFRIQETISTHNIMSYEDSHLSANSESDVGRKIRILPAICDMLSKNNHVVFLPPRYNQIQITENLYKKDMRKEKKSQSTHLLCHSLLVKYFRKTLCSNLYQSRQRKSTFTCERFYIFFKTIKSFDSK